MSYFEVIATSSDAPVEWGSSTDATFYTVEVEGGVSSVAEQQTAYLLDLRNIILIIFLSFLVIKFYQMLKNTIINFFEK